MTPLCQPRCVDDSQVVDYEFRHDDGRADELPSDRVKILFAPANSALGSSFEKLSPALLHIFGQALRPNHVVIKYFAA
jgi:hypothetical protein